MPDALNELAPPRPARRCRGGSAPLSPGEDDHRAWYALPVRGCAHDPRPPRSVDDPGRSRCARSIDTTSSRRSSSFRYTQRSAMYAFASIPQLEASRVLAPCPPISRRARLQAAGPKARIPVGIRDLSKHLDLGARIPHRPAILGYARRCVLRCQICCKIQVEVQSMRCVVITIASVERSTLRTSNTLGSRRDPGAR